MDGPFYFRSSTRRYSGGEGAPHIFPNRAPTFVNPALFSSVEHTPQNHQRNCHQHNTDSSRVTKFVFGRGSAPDPVGELITFPQTPYSAGDGDTLPHCSVSYSRHLAFQPLHQSVLIVPVFTK